MRLKLTPTILVPTALALLIAVATSALFSAASHSSTLTDTVSAQQERLTAVLGVVHAGSVKFGKMDPVKEQLVDLTEGADDSFAGAAVVDAQGKVLLAFPETNPVTEGLAAAVADAAATDAQVVRIVNNVRYVAVPVRFGKENATVGAFGMAADLGELQASSYQKMLVDLAIGLGIGLVALAGLGLLLMLRVTRPISRLTAFATELSHNRLDAELVTSRRNDELGELTAALSVFRQNALAMRDLKSADERRTVEIEQQRRETMADLQKAFGQVVGAARDGDLTARVDTNFADPELNGLAATVNQLLETVDRSLIETGDVLAALAKQDLRRRVEGDYSGAFGALKDNANAVADRLEDIVQQLRQTSSSLKTATGEILSGANDLSERTTKQAATIEETSAAMEQLAQTVLSTAERAADASQNAEAVTAAAEEGGTVMVEANEAMERITQSSGKISNIIGMIDDIAFQTNLLALNASVEAARAGEAGKGFAVVAVEVRRLAQSAAEASSEVKALIEQSATEVNSGSKLVAQAAHKLETMLDSVRRNRELLDAIAKESRQQSASIDEVVTAVRQMDEMTQHNAALVEETNAAIEQTEAQASELDNIVAVFTVSGAAAAPEAIRKPVKPAAKPASEAPARGIKALQQKVKAAAKTYLNQGNAAVKADDWAEF